MQQRARDVQLQLLFEMQAVLGEHLSRTDAKISVFGTAVTHDCMKSA